MPSLVGPDVPLRVALHFEPEESVVATLPGLGESGFALTEHRLFGWRANGTSAPVPIPAIDRLLVERRSGTEQIEVVVLPRHALHPPLVLTHRGDEAGATLAFVSELARLAGQEPLVDQLGPVQRFLFGR